MLNVKIMHPADCGDNDSRKPFTIISDVEEIEYNRTEEGQTILNLALVGGRTRCVHFDGNVYIMNEAGKTISSCSPNDLPRKAQVYWVTVGVPGVRTLQDALELIAGDGRIEGARSANAMRLYHTILGASQVTKITLEDIQGLLEGYLKHPDVVNIDGRVANAYDLTKTLLA